MRERVSVEQTAPNECCVDGATSKGVSGAEVTPPFFSCRINAETRRRIVAHLGTRFYVDGVWLKCRDGRTELTDGREPRQETASVETPRGFEPSRGPTRLQRVPPSDRRGWKARIQRAIEGRQFHSVSRTGFRCVAGGEKRKVRISRTAGLIAWLASLTAGTGTRTVTDQSHVTNHQKRKSIKIKQAVVLCALESWLSLYHF